ncbi:MAG: TlpA family protein disulfide reductase [Erythrobacter sp.]
MSRSLLIACLSVAFLAGCDRAADEGAQPADAGEAEAAGALTGTIDASFAGTALPDLVLEDGDGRTLDLGAMEGPVLLNLWATWCAPCVVEMPQLDELAGTLEGEVRVITVSQDLRGAQAVAPFFAAKRFTRLEPWLDPETQLSAQFSEAGQLPLTILFDASGKEIWRVAGGYEWAGEAAIAKVRKGLAPN